MTEQRKLSQPAAPGETLIVIGDVGGYSGGQAGHTMCWNGLQEALQEQIDQIRSAGRARGQLAAVDCRSDQCTFCSARR